MEKTVQWNANIWGYDESKNNTLHICPVVSVKQSVLEV